MTCLEVPVRILSPSEAIAICSQKVETSDYCHNWKSIVFKNRYAPILLSLAESIRASLNQPGDE